MNNTLLDGYVEELLHVEDVDKNKLVDLYASNKAKTFILSYEGNFLAKHVLGIIAKRIGKPGNTVMRHSAEVGDEQIVGEDVNYVDWLNADGVRDSASLRKFVSGVYKELSLKGNNPLFLGVGALEWKVARKGETKVVKSPLIIFPVKLIRSDNASTPVYIEFINEYNISKITLPIINYQKSNLNILDDEWWNNDF